MNRTLVCVVPGCQRNRSAREWCSGHYQRWYQHGDVQAHVPLRAKRPNGEGVQRPIPPSRVTGCASCGKAVWKTRTSAANPHCQECRLSASTNKAPAPDTRQCANCDMWFGREVGKKLRTRYCSDECFRKARNRRGSGVASSTTRRGYGAAHARLRRELLPTAYGTPCVLCGDVMVEGDSLHLDHMEDRSGYRGFAHAHCNVMDGARRGGQRFRERILGGCDAS